MQILIIHQTTVDLQKTTPQKRVQHRSINCHIIIVYY